MPYPRAHWYVIGVIGIIIIGFWPSYFSQAPAAPWVFHFHAVTSSLWMVLLVAQSWTVHRRNIPLHRLAGKGSLFLFPFVIAGLVAIIDFTAKAYVTGSNPSRPVLGPPFAIALMLAIAAYCTVYFLALKHRRKVWLHAGYMLATPFILWESAFSRVLMGLFPQLRPTGTEDLWKVPLGISIAMATALLPALVLWLRDRKRGVPFLVTAAFIAAQIAGMWLLADAALVHALLRATAHGPTGVWIIAGLLLGTGAAWAGWVAGPAGRSSGSDLKAA